MDIMSYNIYQGGQERLDKVVRVVKTYSPAILAIQEANTFLNEEKALAKQFSKDVGLPNFEIASGGEDDYHVATFAKEPFKIALALKPFRNACLQIVTGGSLGEIAIFNVHLSPLSEDDRVREIDRIIEASKNFRNSVLIGDFNSLSINDNYDASVIGQFNANQLKKFTHEGVLRHEVVGSLLASGFYDCGAETNIPTVPTAFNTDSAHDTPLRLDYAFVSADLKPRVKSFRVIKTNETNTASDHYPILLTLG